VKKIFLDKKNVLSFSIKSEGANKTTARLIIEMKNFGVVYNCSINKKEGTVELTNLKNFLKENDEVKLKLEVIADDVLFQPWTDNFVAENSIMVNSTLIESKVNKPIISVSLKESKINEYIKDIEYVIKEVKKVNKFPKIRILEIIDKYAKAKKIINSKELFELNQYFKNKYING